jgi:hypothetical protein
LEDGLKASRRINIFILAFYFHSTSITTPSMSVQLIDPMARPAHEKKDKGAGIITSVIVHALIILLLLFLGFSSGGGGGTGGDGEGIPVDFGTSDMGAGDITPTSIDPSQPTPTPQQQTLIPVTPQQEDDKDIVTADDPESFALADKKKNTPVKPVVTEPVKETAKPVVTTPTPPVKVEPKTDQKAMFPGKKGTTNTSGSQGDDPAGTMGDKGQTNGTTAGTYKGPGGTGSPGTGGGTGGGNGTGNGPGDGAGNGPGKGGPSYSLGTRKLLNARPITGQVQEPGKVVVRIKVNRQGNVTSVECGAPGTTLTSPLACQTAKDEAYRMKFNASNDAPVEQSGTVTFTFVPR